MLQQRHQPTARRGPHLWTPQKPCASATTRTIGRPVFGAGCGASRRSTADTAPGHLVFHPGCPASIDQRELLPLKLVSVRGRGADERVYLRGAAGGETLTVEWLPALQLPAKLIRTGKSGAVTRIELQQHAAAAPTTWPRPGDRSANYLRIDAADFGDMDYEAVVKKSEALDIRLGWRAAHKHD